MSRDFKHPGRWSVSHSSLPVCLHNLQISKAWGRSASLWRPSIQVVGHQDMKQGVHWPADFISHAYISVLQENLLRSSSGFKVMPILVGKHYSGNHYMMGFMRCEVKTFMFTILILT